jgi:G3E family GTPase
MDSRPNDQSVPTPVVLMCGFWPHVTAEVARQLLTDNPTRRHLRYEAPRPVCGDPAGALVRDLATAGRGQDGLLVTVPEGYEPDQIRTAWRAQTGGGAPNVITVVPADLVLDGLTDETALRAVDLHGTATDDRSIADLVSRQIEQADTVLMVGPPDDQWEADQLRVLLHRIAPWSQHRSLDDVCLTEAGRTEPVAPITRGLRGRAVGAHEPLPDHGVVAWVFQARRPFHPQRLHDALDEITDGVLRSRGHFWLASRPELVMTWESAGGLSLGPHSGWLADLPGEHWGAVDPERRLAAAVDWDPYYGDRHQHLAFVGIGADPVHVHRALAGCLLTDDELADGAESWVRLPDPFARCFRLATTQENPK